MTTTDTTTTEPTARTYDLAEMGSPHRLTIGGVDYVFQSIRYLPPADLLTWRRLSERLYALTGQTRLTREEEQEFNTLPDRLVRLMVLAPDDVHRTLDDRRRMAVIQTFLNQE